MAAFNIGPSTLEIGLSVRERALLGRPNLSLEINRVKSASLVPFPDKAKLGARVSRRLLFTGFTGEWRIGSSRILVFKGKPGSIALKIILKHPNIDEIWYSGSDAKQVFELLAEKLAR